MDEIKNADGTLAGYRPQSLDSITKTGGEYGRAVSPLAPESAPTERNVMAEFDEAQAKAERLGQELDGQLIAIIRDFQVWKDKIPWTEPAPTMATPPVEPPPAVSGL